MEMILSRIRWNKSENKMEKDENDYFKWFFYVFLIFEIKKLKFFLIFWNEIRNYHDCKKIHKINKSVLNQNKLKNMKIRRLIVT